MTGCDAGPLASSLTAGTPAPRTTGVECLSARSGVPRLPGSRQGRFASASGKTFAPRRTAGGGSHRRRVPRATPAAISLARTHTPRVVTVAADDGLDDL